MSGYTYQPGQQVTVPIDPAVSQPLMPHQPPGDSIDNYRAKRPTGWLILIGIVVIAAIVGGIIITRLPQPQANPSPSPTRPTSYATDTRYLDFGGMPMPGVWIGAGVVVTL